MTKWRHRPTLDQTHIGAPFGPASESVPGKFRPPSEPANDRLQQEFDQMSQAGICTDPTEEDHLSARPEHSGALVERCLRIWHGRNHVISPQRRQTKHRERTDARRPSPPESRHWSGTDLPRVAALCGASARIDLSRLCDCERSSREARCQYRRRLRESGRQPARLRRSPPDARDRTKRQRPNRIPEPSGHRPSVT